MKTKSVNLTVIYLTVFTTGASIMVVELLGTRLIAPFFGASLYVWSSLISVTMMALAAGYFIGGRLADRYLGKGLSIILAAAATLTLLIPWFTRSVQLSTEPLGLRLGAFLSALILFSPCLTALGMVSPFAIKLATRHLNQIGSSSGTIYSVSTVGSVVGTIMLGFFLFPEFGSREILFGTGLTLSALAFFSLLIERKLSPSRNLMTGLSTLAIIAVGLFPQILVANNKSSEVAQKFTIRYEKESLYGWVRVIDQPKQKLRFLTSDASMIGAASLLTGQNLLTYQKIVSLLPELRSDIKKALIVGQGAGHMAMALNDKYDITVDTLEIDPAVSEAATKFFGFKPSGNAIVGDARYEIRKLQGPYDLIIHDCFTGGTEPSHLLTIETLNELKSLLSERGLLAINFVGFFDDGENKAIASVAKTINSVFIHQKNFVSEPGENFNDFIFLTSDHKINLTAQGLTSQAKQWLNSRLVRINPDQGQLLTDNYNALEHLQLKKSEKYREVLTDWFGSELLLR